MSRSVVLAAFESEETLLAGLRSCRENGLDVLDVRTPYPVHGIDELAGVPPSRLPAVCLTGGIVGLALALWFQYWTSSVDWPIDVGGKPWNSLPAFAPVAFEMTVLLAGLSTVAGIILGARLRPGKQADLGDLRVTDDRLVMLVARRDAALTRAGVESVLRAAGAVETVDLVEGER